MKRFKRLDVAEKAKWDAVYEPIKVDFEEVTPEGQDLTYWNQRYMQDYLGSLKSVDRYKLIHFYFDVDEWELYDLEKDPDELNNLYGQKGYEVIQANLHERLTQLRIQFQDASDI